MTTTDAQRVRQDDIDVRLWDAERTSDTTGIPLGTLAQHRHRGIGLPYVRVGRLVRYRPADLDAWMRENTVTTGTTGGHRD